MLARMSVHQKDAWLNRRRALIRSAVGAAEAAALSCCLSMRSTGYQPGEYAALILQQDALFPMKQAAETAARAVLLG